MLDEHKTVMLLVNSQLYNETILEIVQELSQKKVCYISLNKTRDSLIDLFSKKGVNVNNIGFIDAITKTIMDYPDETENCTYISSPGALTELAIAITKFLKLGFDYLIFDSLTNLLIYQKRAPIEKFMSNLINKIRNTETRAIFCALGVQEQQLLLEQCGMFVDNVVDNSKMVK